ncbi:MAG TPA: C39 family peptidase [Anaerolineales bacterium]|nr:C39 family peptidase [Anaerolineales bacterium]HNN13432.1 C39 family peptidase [Anaerolineales bacterium]HNO31593.1 C39 family peptidase [Anaerolineales bacterium]
MSRRIRTILIGLAGLLLLAFLVYQIPAVKSRVDWRLDVFQIYAKNVIDPVGPVPTALPVTVQPATSTPQVTNTTVVEVLPSATATFPPLPPQFAMTSPAYEKQTPNNCGPATLSMALHMYGWEGTQKDISDLIKPVTGDRNVNPEELRYYVRTQAGWLNLEYRVGGNLETIKRLLAANYPVIVESVTSLNPADALGPNDDLWAAHYLLITGYDDNTQTFTIQDSYHGPDLSLPYAQLEKEWKPFNNLYIVMYFPEFEEEMKTLLASNWDPDLNRQNTLSITQAATATDSADAFDWFNYGSNLVYFERYEEAALAYDKAREIGLPLRMFRYQFGPFLAYFHSGRNDDLLALTNYARGVTEMSEETWLWYGYGLYRQGDNAGALKAWQKADSINPNFFEDQARNALQLVQ